MLRQSISSVVGPEASARGRGLAAAVLVAAGLGLAPAQALAWGPSRPPSPAVMRAAPPDRTWLNDVPEQPGARSKGRVAVFTLKGDDVYEPVRAAVVKTLRRKGLVVTATLRPVDSAAQYREMSVALNVGIYVDGVMTGEGAHQTARIWFRSGLTGQHIATATFTGPTPKIVRAVERSLWSRVGGTAMRACSGASHARRHERQPLRIDASTA